MIEVHERRGGWCERCGGTGSPDFEHVDVDTTTLVDVADEIEVSGLVTSTGSTDDKIEALHAATRLLAPASPSLIDALCSPVLLGPGDVDPMTALGRATTRLADVFVAWLRRPVKISFGPPVITEQGSSEIVSTGEGNMATIDTSQVVTWDVDPEDDRGFDVDVVLDVANSDDSVATVEFIPKTDTELAKVRATAVAPGATLITVSVAGTDPLVSGSLAVDVVPGGVATIEFGEPVITEQPVPEPPTP